MEANTFARILQSAPNHLWRSCIWLMKAFHLQISVFQTLVQTRTMTAVYKKINFKSVRNLHEFSIYATALKHSIQCIKCFGVEASLRN